MKKFRLLQYIPSFIDNDNPKTIEFDTLEEFLEIPFVQRLMENSDYVLYHRHCPDGIYQGYTDDEYTYLLGRMTPEGKRVGYVCYLTSVEFLDTKEWSDDRV